MKSTQDRIDYLKKCSDLYETNGKSPMTDEEYDNEYAELKRLSPNNPFFKTVGGIDESAIFGTKVKHEITMGSLNKSPNIEDFETWLRNTFKDKEQDFISNKLTFSLEYKIDGLSLACIYKGGKLFQVLSRGDGSEGVDYTANAKHINGVQQTIDYTQEVEFRGECYKDKKDFYENWAGEYANPRNFTSGSINQKDPLVTKERGLSFICYEVKRRDFHQEFQKTDFIQSLGFPSLLPYLNGKWSRIGGNFNNIVAQVKAFMESIDRSSLPFDIDGIVVKINDTKLAQEMGSTNDGRRPRANRAVKFAC
jgi:DNA ligase (NAD+)